MSGERGSATVWAIVAMALVVAVTAVMAALGVVLVTRERAATAADASVLAAAGDVSDGSVAACARGQTIARANGARLASCTVEGAVATVSAIVSLPGPLARWGAATVMARAGP